MQRAGSSFFPLAVTLGRGEFCTGLLGHQGWVLAYDDMIDLVWSFGSRLMIGRH